MIRLAMNFISSPAYSILAQIIDSRIRIGPPHALNKCGYRVVVIVPVLVVAHRALLDTLLSHVNVDMDLSISSHPAP